MAENNRPLARGDDIEKSVVKTFLESIITKNYSCGKTMSHVISEAIQFVSALLDILDISKSDVHTMLNICNNALRNYELSWKNCLTYSLGNINFMVVKDKSLSSLIRKQHKNVAQNKSLMFIFYLRKGTKHQQLTLRLVVFNILHHF